MKRVLGFIVIPVLIVAALCTGCGTPSHIEEMERNTKRMAAELEHDREYIKSIAESLAMLQKFGTEVVSKIMDMLSVQAKPAPTSDIDDVIKNLPAPPPIQKDIST